MIKSFEHQGLRRYYETGSKSGIQAKHATRLRLQLAAPDTAGVIDDMDVPGYRLPGHCKIRNLSRLSGISKRTLQRHFASLGLTFTEVLEEGRFEEARDLLGDGDLPINEIACLRGFSYATHFSRAFKRSFGLTFFLGSNRDFCGCKAPAGRITIVAIATDVVQCPDNPVISSPACPSMSSFEA